MATIDPRTPVIVGVGQLSQRVDQGEPGLEPLDLIAEAARRAAKDGERDGVLAGVESIRIVNLLSWRYRDPGGLVAERLGIAPRQSIYTTGGGQTPQALLSATADDIAAGRLDAALIAGGEAWRTRMGHRSRGEKPPWTRLDDEESDAESWGSELDMNDEAELALGLALPVQMYPIFETALRAEAGRSVAEHTAHLGRLWARFSEIAADNPHAWIREPLTPEQVVTPTEGNRYIGFPYTKVMNSNNNVEQSAAVLLCSAERAGSLGVPRDRWVFPHVGTEANDTAHASHRGSLDASPAIRAAGRTALALAHTDAASLAHVDLYSCFPSAVQIAAREIGFSLDRDLTVTGGMSFAGGPWNNYALHAIAAMVERLRGDPGTLGLCSANGGFVTKHAIGVYGTQPPVSGFRRAQPQAEADAGPRREVVADHEGPATVEGYTVMHDRDGEPETAFAAALTPDGRRTWATTADPDTLRSMREDEWVGRAVDVRGNMVHP